MDLKTVSVDCMRSQTKQIAKEEREALTKMLHHLKEIERRRLFSAWKFKSLFDYAVNELGYSSDQADRRIAAMRLLKELPELEEKINSGAFTLTNLGMARTLFKKERYSTATKAEFLKKIEHKSVRDTARIIATVSPQVLNQDKIRPVSESKDEFRFLVDPSLKDKLEKLKGLLAHSHPGISLGELIDKLADLGLKEWDKTALPRDRERQKSDSQAGIRREVFRRDRSCTNCGSTFALETDHCIGKAMGGPSTLKNFRLLCRNCNQRAAIEAYGMKKMEKFLKSPCAKYSGQ